MRDGLDALIAPRSVAVIGASPRAGHFANQPLANLRRHGFTGAVYPVNPSHQEVCGYRCYPSVADLPEVPELAIVVVRPDAAVDAIRQVGALGTAAAVVVGSGFAETGSADGVERQAALLETVERTGLRICGPNTLGIANFHSGAVTYASGNIPASPRPGAVAIVSQSGGCSFTLLNRASWLGIGVGHVAVAGNEIDVTIPELIGRYLEQDDVRVVACYLEAIRDAAGLRTVARRADELGKAVFVMKSGVSALGQRAAAAHTGALATPDAVCDAAFASWGLRRAHTFDELLGAAALAARFGRGAKHRFGIYAVGGGVAVVGSDLFAGAGLPLADIGPDTIEHIKVLMPDTTPGNPFDSGGQFLSSGAGVLTEALEAFNADSGVTATVHLLLPVTGARAAVYTEGIAAAARVSEKPGIVLQYGAGEMTRTTTETLVDAGLVVLDPPEAGVTALRLWARPVVAGPAGALSRRADAAAAGAGRDLIAEWRRAGRTVLGELAARELLALYGIPTVQQRRVPIGAGTTEIHALAGELQPPYVLKIDSDDLPHRSDIGGVELGLADAPAVAAAAQAMIARVRELRPAAAIAGTVLSETAPSGTETIVGFRVDPTFGPVVLLGTGGVDAEMWDDVALRLPPIGPPEVDSMVTALRSSSRLRGSRGRAPADLPALTDIVLRVADLAADLGAEIATVEMNPVIVAEDGGGAVAADALIELAPAP